MQASYLVARAIKKKLQSWSKQSVINWLATYVGGVVADQIVSTAINSGLSGLASYLAAHVSWLGFLAGPIGGIATAILGGL